MVELTKHKLQQTFEHKHKLLEDREYLLNQVQTEQTAKQLKLVNSQIKHIDQVIYDRYNQLFPENKIL